MSERIEFEEIAHTGGKVTFHVMVDSTGKVCYQIEFNHARPSLVSMFAVYAIPQGVAVADIALGGINQPWNPPPLPSCLPVFISSDGTGMFGHQCPSCKGYWRAKHGSKICPYCALVVGESFHFLTEAQQRYVAQYCDVLRNALASGQAGEHTIDMDSVADAAGKDCEKPAFFYVEESQQNLYTCQACGDVNDVLGTYAYCGTCGTRNDLQENAKTLQGLRDRINAGGAYEAAIRDAVAAFDSFAGEYAKQLLSRVPLTPARRAQLGRTRFHDLEAVSGLLRTIFDIDILDGMSAEDIAFGRKMFYRRHVYEHKGGEADEKYVAVSGDAVRVKQTLRETQESAHRAASLVMRLMENLHKGFHEIFPPVEEPIRRYKRG